MNSIFIPVLQFIWQIIIFHIKPVSSIQTASKSVFYAFLIFAYLLLLFSSSLQLYVKNHHFLHKTCIQHPENSILHKFHIFHVHITKFVFSTQNHTFTLELYFCTKAAFSALAHTVVLASHAWRRSGRNCGSFGDAAIERF